MKNHIGWKQNKTQMEKALRKESREKFIRKEWPYLAFIGIFVAGMLVQIIRVL